MQLRVNAETMSADGIVRPAAGVLDAFDPPAGPGVRVDTCGHGGFRVNPRFDSLLAKVIVHVTPGDLSSVAAKARRALSEFRISGVSSNREFLLNLLSSPDFVSGHWHTGLIEDNLASLCAPGQHPRLYGEPSNASAPAAQSRSHRSARDSDAWQARHRRVPSPDEAPLPEGTQAISAAISGTVVSIDVRVGDSIQRGQQVAVMEAMKMEHVVASDVTGVVREIRVAQNQTLLEGAALLTVDVGRRQSDVVAVRAGDRSGHVRPDLAELQQRRALTLDAARPDAVEKRHKLGLRTARENIADLCDPGSFHEYGAFTVAAQRSRRTMEDLIARTPADGLVMGIGRVNGDAVSRCRRALRGDVLRLHRAGRHAGRQESREERPHVRTGGAVATAGHRVRRRRRRTSGRYRRDRRRLAAHQSVHAAGQVERTGSAGRHRVGTMLCRKRGGRGLLRCDHRHREDLAGHGRPRHDRRRRTGRVPSG